MRTAFTTLFTFAHGGGGEPGVDDLRLFTQIAGRTYSEQELSHIYGKNMLMDVHFIKPYELKAHMLSMSCLIVLTKLQSYDLYIFMVLGHPEYLSPTRWSPNLRLK